MKRLYTLISIEAIVFVAALVVSCSCPEQNKEAIHNIDTNEIIIQAESYHNAQGDVKIIENKYVEFTSEGWIALDVDVKTAGRYKVELVASSTSDKVGTVWIEDYYDNKDERTYNITGSMLVPNSGQGFEMTEKTGSPLNTGVHKMKLHTNNPVKVDYVKFSLIRKHKNSPTAMIQNVEGDEWKLVWSDEFDGEVVDTSKWTFDFGDWGWGNNELQFYTDNRTENARIEDGNLVIEARKDDNGHKWTSARLTTRGKVSFKYGKIEFRAKVPAEKGNWAAGWTLGDDYIDELSWPYCGEIDIMESVGYEMDNETGNGIAHASAHSRAYYFKLGNQPTSTIDVENMNQAYHTYAVDWTPDYIKIFVDGIEYFDYNDNTTENAWPFDKPHNIILNLAMGGGWGGAQGMDESITSQKMIVDYVRVYERK